MMTPIVTFPLNIRGYSCNSPSITDRYPH